jgi:cytoskeleton protein RodZ
MLSVGETLRRARQQQGLDLSAVAAQTKISSKYLEAIESDNRKILPSGFFYKSFVEQYAKSLSLDTHEIDAELDRVLSADEPLPLPGFENVVARNLPPMRSSPRFQGPRWFASTVGLALVLAACSGFYAWWHDWRASFSLARVMEHVHGFSKSAPVPSTSVPKPAAPKVVAKADSAHVRKPAPVPVVAKPSAPAPEHGPPELVAAAAQHQVLLDLLAREATWLSVSSDGKPVFSGTLQANETKTVSGKQFAKIRVGNAAGLEVRLNGRLLGPLGARGQVLTVLFTPDNFEVVAPPKESD